MPAADRLAATRRATTRGDMTMDQWGGFGGSSPTADTGVRGYIDAHAREFFDTLNDWLAIPSISADPERSADVRRSAEWLAEYLRQVGFVTAEVWETGAPDSPGKPAVFAHWPAADPGAQTVLIY